MECEEAYLQHIAILENLEKVCRVFYVWIRNTYVKDYT